MHLATVFYRTCSKSLLLAIADQAKNNKIAESTIHLHAKQIQQELLNDVYDPSCGLISHSNIRLVDHGDNRGLAKTWNCALRHSARSNNWPIVIANDDINCTSVQLEDALRKFATALSTKEPRFAVIKPASGNGGFSFFGMNQSCYSKVGPFDERIAIAYYEDSDYSYRLKMCDIEIMYIECSLTHETCGTASRLSDSERQALISIKENNKRYYIRKWGGAVGHEKYAYPFGLNNESQCSEEPNEQGKLKRIEQDIRHLLKRGASMNEASDVATIKELICKLEQSPFLQLHPSILKLIYMEISRLYGLLKKRSLQHQFYLAGLGAMSISEN